MKNREFSGELPESEKQNKRELYENLCQGTPDAIFVFGGTIVKNENTGEYKSGSYSSLDPHGLMAGNKARSIAAAELYEQFPESKVVAISTIPARNDQPEQRFHDVTAAELRHYGVNDRNIIHYEESYSTFTELIGLIKLAVEHQWHHPVVITSDTSVERTRLLFEKLAEIKDNNDSYQRVWAENDMDTVLKEYEQLGAEMTVVAAESILPIRDESYKTVIDKVHETEEYRQRAESETQAEQDLLDGTYGRPEKNRLSFIEHPKK